jgi:hypothetical protein
MTLLPNTVPACTRQPYQGNTGLAVSSSQTVKSNPANSFYHRHKKGAVDAMHLPPLTLLDYAMTQEPCETMYSTAPRSSSSLQFMQPPFGGMALSPFVTD